MLGAPLGTLLLVPLVCPPLVELLFCIGVTVGDMDGVGDGVYVGPCAKATPAVMASAAAVAAATMVALFSILLHLLSASSEHPNFVQYE